MSENDLYNISDDFQVIIVTKPKRDDRRARLYVAFPR